MFNGRVEMLSLYMRCSTEESRCYRYALDVQRMSRDAIVVHDMFNRGIEMLSLHIRCSTDESRYFKNAKSEELKQGRARDIDLLEKPKENQMQYEENLKSHNVDNG
ncbi:hypothetical protein Tco_0635473 [Tanacetum coccineum]